MLLPWFTLWLPGVAEMLKSGGGVTTRVTLALWLRLPLAPLMVIGNDPVAAVLAVVTVSVDDPPPATDVGLKDPPASVPKPEALKLTVPAKPFWAVTVTA